MRSIPSKLLFSSSCKWKNFGNVLGGNDLNTVELQTFNIWHDAVKNMHRENISAAEKEQVLQKLHDKVDPNCRFHPPTYFKYYEGRDETLLLLSCVSEVFGASFTYGRQWVSSDGKEWALEFTAMIGDTGKKMTGIDLITLNDEGKIKDFMVLARPPNAVAELQKLMMQKVPLRMAKLKAKQAFSFGFGSSS